MTSLVAYWDQFPPPTTSGGGGTGTVTNINTTGPITGGPITTTGTIGITDFVGSGVGHARGAVPDPGAVAGSTKFLCENGLWATPAGGAPGGSNTQVQFNDSGSFGGDADFTWDKTNNILTLGTASRIQADTSNATQANRFWFQNSQTNANTNFGVLPNGSATTAVARFTNNSNPAAALTLGQVGQVGTVTILDATVLNAGTQGTMELRIAGVAKQSFDTSGNVTFANNVAVTGNLNKIQNVPLVWPVANASGALTNDGLGNLSWSAAGGAGAFNWGKAIALQQGALHMTRGY